MSDLFAPAPGNQPELSVSDLAGAIRRTLEGAFGLVRVKGEIGRVTFHANGHIYLDLKDDKATINAVIFRLAAQRLKMKPEEGLEVVATGRLTTFEKRSVYQLVIEDLAPSGTGALMALLEKRRKALGAEGLFDAARKRKLPFLPEVIGVITSPTGAVIRDILHRLADRFPRRVLLWPVVVQGERAAGEVAAAIAGFNRLAPGGAVPRPDVLIVARGGGSIEDLWPFNEEIVVRAAAASAIPLISAVGHETDTTLIDFAADLRAPTPTAAAELAVPVRAELIAQTAALGRRQTLALRRVLAERRRHFEALARNLPRAAAILDAARQTLGRLGERLPRALAARASRAEARLARAASRVQPATLLALVRVHRRRLGELIGRGQAATLRRPADGRRALAQASERLGRALTRHLRQSREEVARERMRLQGLAGRLAAAETQGRIAAAQRLAQAARLLEGFSFERTLERGFAVVTDRKGHVVRSGLEARHAKSVRLRFSQADEVAARVEGEAPKADEPAAPPQKRLL